MTAAQDDPDTRTSKGCGCRFPVQAEGALINEEGDDVCSVCACRM